MSQVPDADRDRVSTGNRFARPFLRFLHSESAGGIVLLVATVVAIVWANSGWAEAYEHLLETPVSVHAGSWNLSLSLHHFINDGLMAVFFLLVGLEIKRELMVGELASLRAATLPIAGALGGMIAPATIYSLLNAGGEGIRGWGIPMATDIAFALGILALLGPRIPLGLKIFLAALAIADDLGAVLVIAIFYTADLSLTALAWAGALLTLLFGMNRGGVRHAAAYGTVGLFLWFAVYESGIHATVAGVLLAFAIPARTRIDTQEFLESGRRILDEFDQAGVEAHSVLTNQGQQEAIMALESNCEGAQTPLRRMEHRLHHLSAFLIIPLFALANAGVELPAAPLEALRHPVGLGIIAGLLLGKTIGISFFSWVVVRAGLAVLPQGVGWRGMFGVSLLGGIGFTMSLFIATLAFGEGSPLLDLAKIGILCASVIAALAGGLVLKTTSFAVSDSRSGPP